MAELFGTPNGQHLAEQDMARVAMTMGTLQHQMNQDALIPSTAQQRSAQARYLNTKAGAAERESAVQARVASMAAGQPVVEADERNPAWRIARAFEEAGAPEKAVKIAGVAASIDARQSSAARNDASASLAAGREAIVRIDMLSRSMRMVDSPQALQAALVRHEEATGEQTGLLQNGQLVPQAAVNWQDTATKIQEMAVSERDRLALDIRERALASANTERTSRQAARTFWQDMGNQEARAAAQARARGKKAGAISALDKIDPKLGTDYINSQFLSLDPTQGRILGRQVAERAAQMRQLNPALTPSEATQNAFQAMQDAGDFQGLRQRPPGARDSEARPLPLPEKKDASKLKAGFWYTDGTQKMLWTGTGWDKTQTKGGKGKIRESNLPAYSAPNLEDDEDTSEEDDALALEE